MFGCIGRLGCLFVVLVLGAVGYLTRGIWMPMVGMGERPAPTSALEGQWEPVTPARAARARTSIERLGRPSGPVFASLTGAELASYVLDQVGRSLTEGADSVRATVIGDRMLVRGNVPLRALGGSGILGPLAGMLGDKEPLELSGRFRVVRPGLGEVEVDQIRLRDIPIPRAILPRVVRQLSRAPGTEGISPTGLPVRIPEYLGDVRIANGRITLYRTVAEGGR